MITAALFVVALVGTPPQTIDCEDPRTQLAINQCAGMKAAKAEGRLNEIYRQYRQRLGVNQKKKLTEAQMAWLAFRKSWCTFVASGIETGSAHPFVVSECMTGITEQRIKQLEEVRSCKQGDLSCP